MERWLEARPEDGHDECFAHGRKSLLAEAATVDAHSMAASGPLSSIRATTLRLRAGRPHVPMINYRRYTDPSQADNRPPSRYTLGDSYQSLRLTVTHFRVGVPHTSRTTSTRKRDDRGAGNRLRQSEAEISSRGPAMSGPRTLPNGWIRGLEIQVEDNAA